MDIHNPKSKFFIDDAWIPTGIQGVFGHHQPKPSLLVTRHVIDATLSLSDDYRVALIDRCPVTFEAASFREDNGQIASALLKSTIRSGRPGLLVLVNTCEHL